MLRPKSRAQPETLAWKDDDERRAFRDYFASNYCWVPKVARSRKHWHGRTTMNVARSGTTLTGIIAAAARRQKLAQRPKVGAAPALTPPAPNVGTAPNLAAARQKSEPGRLLAQKSEARGRAKGCRRKLTPPAPNVGAAANLAARQSRRPAAARKSGPTFGAKVGGPRRRERLPVPVTTKNATI